MNFLGMTFLSPLFLIGIASAAIPFLVHLSRSRRTKTMRFSTTRFFTDQFLRSYRMSRLKELFLLLCRMALFGLLATALAQPLVLPKNSPGMMSGSRAVVFVLDNSASMDQHGGEQPLMERVREAGRAVLDGLRPGDTASIVLAGRRDAGPTVLYDTPTTELNDVRQALSDTQPATLGTDLSTAVTRAQQIAQASAATSKEVYILSDLQDSGWEITSPSAEMTGSDVSFTFVKLRPTEPDNLAVTAVQYSAARPMIGVPFEIKPYIAFQGTRTEADVRLVIDGRKVSERKVQRPAGTMFATPRFYHAFATPGWHHGSIEVIDDLSPLDNRRYFSFEILESVKILAINGAASQVPRLDELYFFKAALEVSEDEAKSPIQVVTIAPGEFTAQSTEELKNYPLIVLSNVESLSPSALEKLEAFVDGGGRLLVTLGDKVTRATYNDTLANGSRLHGGLLPAKLRKLEGDPVGPDSFATVADVDYDHVALAAFSDPQFANLGSVRFRALWDVELPQGNVLMRSSNGFPLLVEKEYGRGMVLLFTSSIDRDWTNFPVRPAFLPWSQRLIGYLAQGALGRQNFFTTGSPIVIPGAAIQGNVPVIVLLPKADGTPGTLTAYPTTDRDDPNTLVFDDTTQAGIYTFSRADQPDRPAFVAVNLESYESDLTYLDAVFADRSDADDAIVAGFRGLMPSHPTELIRYIDDPATLAEAALTTQRGTKLWDIILLIVLLLALFEPWLANQISLRHYGKANEVAMPNDLQRTGRRATNPQEVTT